MKGVSPLLLGPLEHLTPLSDAQACTLSLIFTASYVGSIYFTNIFAQRSETASTQRANAAAKPSVGRSKTSIGGPGVPPIAATDTDGRVIPVGEEGDEGAQNPKGRAADPDAPKVGDRDHPDTIKRRVVGVSLATGLSLGAVWYVIAVQGSTSLGDAAASTLTLLGLSPSYFTTLAHIVSAGDLKSISMALLPYALAPSMMLGPLYAMYLDGDLPLQGPATFGDGGSSGLKGRLRRWYGEWTWIETRNYVAGPISEELTFRSCLLATAILAKQSPRWLVFGSPLYFGIAHAHHAWNVYTKGRKQGQGVVGALIPAIAGCVFQLTYTSLFGFFATYTHIRTGSVWPAIASHVFCNIMGIYLPTAALARHPKRAKSIWLAYLGGIAGFVWGIRRL